MFQYKEGAPRLKIAYAPTVGKEFYKESWNLKNKKLKRK